VLGAPGRTVAARGRQGVAPSRLASPPPSSLPPLDELDDELEEPDELPDEELDDEPDELPESVDVEGAASVEERAPASSGVVTTTLASAGV
jgi:hypothetical protein